VIAYWAGPRAQWLWLTLTAVVVIIFVVLVILGDSLGDPERVAEVNAAGYTWENRFTLHS
ncbi:MAG: VanZ family protein, partial [Corynebacterium casei]|nr:VanZ family protein [Corynebacterium casei]